MVIRLAGFRCHTLEDYKAWSENIGHENMLTSLQSYGHVPEQRRRALILGLTEDTGTSLLEPMF